MSDSRLPRQASGASDVLPQLPPDRSVVQHGGRMVRGHDGDSMVVRRLLSRFRNARVRGRESQETMAAEGYDDLWIHDVDLLHEIRPACRDLVGSGLPVPRRPALVHARDENVLSPETD